MLLIVGFATIAFAVSLLPKQASAFWPFSSQADAATNTIIPSSSTPTLRAPTNSNPNASAQIALATSKDSALISYSGPSASSNRISVYIVQPGDTLSEIATKSDVSVNTILWANDLKSAKDIHPGDTLIILPVSGIEHKIVKGDTLKSLAKKYGADSDDIATFNGLNSQTLLAIGTAVIIPGGEVATPVRAPRSTSLPSPLRGGGGAFIDGYFSIPVSGAFITQGIHGLNGIDFGAPRGTPINASADGIVIIARNSGWNGGYGKYVVITHNNGTQTLYGHMSNAIVSPGQAVVSGQVIGYAGSTGKSTGAHLHFEVRGAANPFGR